MKNVKLLIISLGAMSLTACLEDKSSKDAPAEAAPSPFTAAQLAVAKEAGCTVEKTGNHMKFTCGESSATFDVGANGNDGHDGSNGAAGAPGATGDRGPQGPAGGGGVSVTDATGVSLGSFISALPYNGVMVYHPTEHVVAVYQADSNSSSQLYAWLPTADNLFFVEANCGGAFYVLNAGLHAKNELFLLDLTHSGTTTKIYKTTGSVARSVSSGSYMDSSRVCTNSVQTVQNVYEAAEATTSMQQKVILPLQYSTN